MNQRWLMAPWQQSPLKRRNVFSSYCFSHVRFILEWQCDIPPKVTRAMNTHEHCHYSPSYSSSMNYEKKIKLYLISFFIIFKEIFIWKTLTVKFIDVMISIVDLVDYFFQENDTINYQSWRGCYTQYGPITNVGIFPGLGVLYFCPNFQGWRS